MKINKNGFWEEPLSVGHGVDKNLAVAIGDFLLTERCHTLVDLGCGNGYYTNYLKSVGIYSVGIDGNPNTASLGKDFFIFDLSKPFMFHTKDWVLSLEVGEHIPKEHEDLFINNVANLAEYGIILSWAIEGQGGDGHVNCRNNDYIVKKLQNLGFEWYEIPTTWLRSKCSPYPETGWWFRNTLMVFRTNLKEYYKKRKEDAI